jgi:hypothetical protein
MPRARCAIVAAALAGTPQSITSRTSAATLSMRLAPAAEPSASNAGSHGSALRLLGTATGEGQLATQATRSDTAAHRFDMFGLGLESKYTRAAGVHYYRDDQKREQVSRNERSFEKQKRYSSFAN